MWHKVAVFVAFCATLSAEVANFSTVTPSFNKSLHCRHGSSNWAAAAAEPLALPCHESSFFDPQCYQSSSFAGTSVRADRIVFFTAGNTIHRSRDRRLTWHGRRSKMARHRTRKVHETPKVATKMAKMVGPSHVPCFDRDQRCQPHNPPIQPPPRPLARPARLLNRLAEIPKYLRCSNWFWTVRISNHSCCKKLRSHKMAQKRGRNELKKGTERII